MRVIFFIKRILLFLIFPVALVLILFFLLNFYNSRLFSNYKLDKSYTTLMIGDSHIEMGLNDHLYPHAINLAKSSDGYIHTYSQLLRLLENNSQVDTILLGYSFHNLSSYYDTFIYGDYSTYCFADYFLIHHMQEKRELLRRNPLMLLRSLQGIFRNGFNNLLANDAKYSFLGHYKVQLQVLKDTSTISKRVHGQFYKFGRLRPFSAIQLKYFGKIVELCRKKNVHLILVNTLMHPFYRQRIPEVYIKKHSALAGASNLPIVDFSDLYIEDRYYAPDGDHLNSKGADLATLYLRDRLRSGNR